RPARRAALADAARDAEGKARSLAQALNCRLGRILEVDEGGVQIQPRVATGLARAMSSVASASSTSVQPGKVKVAASVTMKVAIAAQLKSLAVPGDAESSRPDGR
ncbi:MAG TPA: SIMPL domain-containing protein, partial [Thermoanaerobaculia bacterium]|nr:SIMPL domain-containing protein [Thermoanaerobaculia bacterium]